MVDPAVEVRTDVEKKNLAPAGRGQKRRKGGPQRTGLPPQNEQRRAHEYARVTRADGRVDLPLFLERYNPYYGRIGTRFPDPRRNVVGIDSAAAMFDNDPAATAVFHSAHVGKNGADFPFIAAQIGVKRLGTMPPRLQYAIEDNPRTVVTTHDINGQTDWAHDYSCGKGAAGQSPRSVFGLDSLDSRVEPAVGAYAVRHFRLLAVRTQRKRRGLDLEMGSAFVPTCA